MSKKYTQLTLETLKGVSGGSSIRATRCPKGNFGNNPILQFPRCLPFQYNLGEIDMEQFKKLNYKELQDIQGGSSLFDIPWVKNLLQPKRPIVGLPTPVKPKSEIM